VFFSVFYCVLLPFGVINDDDDNDKLATGMCMKVATCCSAFFFTHDAASGR